LFKSVGIVARFDRKPALKLADELAKYLSEKGAEVFLEDTLEGKVNAKNNFVPLSKMKTDLVLTLGGDGTILRTVMNLPKPEPPVLGINFGVRGFLTETEPKNAIEAIEACFKGEYQVDKCNKLAISIDGEALPDALNDAVITAGDSAKLVYTQIFKDNKPILKCQADGLIVATQTGSTGHSLSGGGPVLDPGVNAFVLTPICSLTVFRSLVFPTDTNLAINVLRPKKLVALIDGNYRKQVDDGDLTVKITRSKNQSSFIRFNQDFYQRLRSRLLFKGTG
jgi:NAD+ kinase